MKKLMMVFIGILFGFQVMAKKGQPILPYGDYSVEEARVFALSDSYKAEKFRSALISLVQRKLIESGENYLLDKNNISWIFDQVEEQETWLDAGQFKNSMWLSSEKKIEFYVSKTRYEGNAGIFEYGKCIFPLYKVSCVNLIDPISKRKPSGSFVEHGAQVPIEVNVNLSGVVDTIYKEVWIQNPEETQPVIVEVNNYGRQQEYYENSYYPNYYSMPVMFSFPLISWGRNYGCNYIGGRDYYYNNQVTNNITNINNNISNTNTNVNVNKWNTQPADPVDQGGPGGADTQGVGGGPGGVGTQPANPTSPGGSNTNNGPGGANTNTRKNASMQQSNSGRRGTSSNTNGSLKSATQRSSSYRSSSTRRSSSYRPSNTSRSSSYRSSPSRSSSYRSSSTNRSPSYKSSRIPSRSSRSSFNSYRPSSRGNNSSFGGRSSRSSGNMSFSRGGSRSSGSGRR